MAADKGVAFRYNYSIDVLVRKGDRIDGMSCGSNIRRADAYVMALGSYSTAYCRMLCLFLFIR
ncbi:hypothetical protein CE195_11180 [Sodalis-like symbiont of Philaenus spumarius]|nr:hypothetical protein CE195_11180 [Sodalis-like symbiont of Philaenus spumarius]